MTGREYIDSAARHLASRVPALFGYYMLTDKVEVDSASTVVRTCARDGKFYLEYNTDRVAMLSTSMLSAVLYMECLRIALNHCGSRQKDPPDIYKIASDMIVAEFARSVVDFGDTENDRIVQRTFPSFWDYREIFADYDFNYNTDFYLEKVFNILCDHPDEARAISSGKKPETQNGEHEENDGDGDSDETTGGTSGDDADDNESTDDESQQNGEDHANGQDTADGKEDGDKCGDGTAGGNPDGDPDRGKHGTGPGPGTGDAGDAEGETPDGPDEPGDSETGDKSGSEDSRPGECSKPKSALETMQAYFGDSSAVERWEGSDLNTAASQTATFDAKYSGTLDSLPGRLRDSIIEANMIKQVDCRELMRNWIGSIRDTRYTETLMRPNRRYGLPFPGKRHDTRANIALAVDVSGSMTLFTEQCLSFVASVSQSIDVDVVFWDTTCSDPSKSTKCTNKYSFSGGGGTRPECVMEHLSDIGKVYSGVIYVTDCYFSWPEPSYAGKVFIIRTDVGGEIPSWCIYHSTIGEITREMN